MHGKEKLTPEQRARLVHENIAEIGMTVGCLIMAGALPKQELDIASSDIAAEIVKWAHEFEDKYEGPDFDYGKGVVELGNPLGYLDAIDNFTDLKLREAGWLTQAYIDNANRFWNGGPTDGSSSGNS